MKSLLHNLPTLQVDLNMFCQQNNFLLWSRYRFA